MTRLATPRRSIFGRGCRVQLFDIAAEHPGPVALIHGASATWAGEAEFAFRDRGRAVHAVLARGEPTLARLEAALARLRPEKPALVVSIGGGAAIDLGKALAALLPATGRVLDYLEVIGKGEKLDAAPLPFIAIPTTAGTGAEATRNAVIGVPEHGRKVSLRDTRMIPDVALLDPDLTDNTPWPVTFASGMDAVTQLIEPYISSRATPGTDALCRAAIGPALRALVTLSQREDPAAREVMLRAAHLGGIALANAGLGAVHGLAGVIGGRSGAAHGAICARLLPGVLAANRAACTATGNPARVKIAEVDRMIRNAFAAPDAAPETLLTRFMDANDMPPLATLLGTADRDAIAAEAEASSSMKANPVPLPRTVLRRLLG